MLATGITSLPESRLELGAAVSKIQVEPADASLARARFLESISRIFRRRWLHFYFTGIRIGEVTAQCSTSAGCASNRHDWGD